MPASRQSPIDHSGRTLNRRHALGLTVGSMAAYAGGPLLAQTTSQVPKEDPAIGVRAIAAPIEGVFRNTFAIETEDGFVVIDAPFRKTDATVARAWFASQGKPILGVLITHMHPDHNFGLTKLLGGADVPIIATPQVAEGIQAAEEALQSVVPNVIGAAETERSRRFPNTMTDSGGTIVLGGVTFRVEDIGAVESAADSIWSLPDHPEILFVGDLIYHDIHTWVAQGETGRYIDALTALQRRASPSTLLHPGHGAVVTSTAIPKQIAYLNAYRSAVAEIAEGRPQMTDREKNALVAKMKAYQPSPVLDFGIAFGADAVAAELAG